MKLFRTVSAAFVTALAAVLFSCTSTGEKPDSAGPTDFTTTVTAPRTAGERSTARSTTPTGTATPAPTTRTTPTATSPPRTTVTATVTARPTTPTPIPCPDPTLDLMSTALGAWLGSQIIPTDQPGVAYYFNVRDNRFDPCAELSWVSLDGVNGSRVAEPGSAEVYTLVFFAGADLITEPAALQFPAAPAVTRISADQLRVIYRNGGDYPVIHQLAGGRLQGSEQLPAHLRAGTRLDFTRSGPPAQGAPRPFGNARYRPWDHDRPVGRWYSVPMGAELINCDFENFNGVQLACLSPTGQPWPLNPPDPGRPGTVANLAVLNFSDPARVDTAHVDVVRDVDLGGGTGDSASAAGSAAVPAFGGGPEPELLRRDSVTRIADVFIDTRSEVVKIHTVNQAFLLGAGVAEAVEVPTFQLDLSRHPGNLLPWTG